MSNEILFAAGIGFLCGGLVGTVLQQLVFRRLLMINSDELPWKMKTRLARYFGNLRWAKAFEQVESSDRAMYATILIGTLHDLGGPLLLAPQSKDAFDGLLAETERRYSELRKKRKRLR